MATAFVLHKVNDYATWRAVYDSVADMLKAGGVSDEAVYQSADDPNNVLVMNRFGSMEQARAFFNSADLREAMGRAGVVESSLRLEFFNDAP